MHVYERGTAQICRVNTAHAFVLRCCLHRLTQKNGITTRRLGPRTGTDKAFIRGARVSRHKQFAVHFNTSIRGAEEIRAGRWPRKRQLDGKWQSGKWQLGDEWKDVNVLEIQEDFEVLQILFVSYLPLNAPCGLLWTSADQERAWILQPALNIMDVYLTIDGKSYAQGHVCCGPPERSREDTINNYVALMAEQGLIDSASGTLVQAALRAGAPKVAALAKGTEGEQGAWASVVADFNAHNHFVLPLFAHCADDVMSSRLGEEVCVRSAATSAGCRVAVTPTS